jgi:hypothetical protein
VDNHVATLHVIYTFFTSKLEPRDPAVADAMKTTCPVLTKLTSLWNCWIGFNGSHGLGIWLFAVTYLFLAVGHMAWLRESPALTWLPVVGSAAYLLLGRYWFRTPIIGLDFATACFLAAAFALSV